MSVTDTRPNSKNKSAPNRKKFLDRYKEAIKEHVKRQARKRSITDTDKESEVTIDSKSIDEPTFHKDRKTGKNDKVFPGNKRYTKGDQIQRPQGSSGSGSQGSQSGDSLDQYTFTLTKEEFMSILFEDMELPDFIKNGMLSEVNIERKRGGFTKEGIPPRLNVKKTLEAAIGRRMAAKGVNPDKKPRFIDDIDMRYDNLIIKKKEVKKAVMFCVMDTSASMGEHQKDIAKRFFLMLYLFLEKNYNEVEVVFIRYHSEAYECDEHSFFYNTDSGGTNTSYAIKEVNEIIDDRYNKKGYNIYVAHASDGDNFQPDNPYLEAEINTLLPKIQYYAYVEILSQYHGIFEKYSLASILHNISDKINVTHINSESEVYKALADLFRRQ